jgi:hypothetical protein
MTQKLEAADAERAPAGSHPRPFPAPDRSYYHRRVAMRTKVLRLVLGLATLGTLIYTAGAGNIMGN